MNGTTNYSKEFDYFINLLRVVNTYSNIDTYLDENYKITREFSDKYSDCIHILKKATTVLSQITDKETLALGQKKINALKKQVCRYCIIRGDSTDSPLLIRERLNLTQAFINAHEIFREDIKRQALQKESYIKELCTKVESGKLKPEEYHEVAKELSSYFNDRSSYTRALILQLRNFLRIKSFSKLYEEEFKFCLTYNPRDTSTIIHDPEEFAISRVLSDKGCFKKAIDFLRTHKELLSPKELYIFKSCALRKFYDILYDDELFLLVEGVSRIPDVTSHEKSFLIKQKCDKVRKLLKEAKTPIAPSHEGNYQEIANTSIVDEKKSSSEFTYTKENCVLLLCKIEKTLHHILDTLQTFDINPTVYQKAISCFTEACKLGTTSFTQKHHQNLYKSLKSNRDTYEKDIDSYLHGIKEYKDSTAFSSSLDDFVKAKDRYCNVKKEVHSQFLQLGIVSSEEFTKIEAATQHNFYYQKFKKYIHNPEKLEKSFCLSLPSPKKLGELDTSSRDFDQFFNDIEQSGLIYDVLSENLSIRSFLDTLLFTKKTQPVSEPLDYDSLHQHNETPPPISKIISPVQPQKTAKREKKPKAKTTKIKDTAREKIQTLSQSTIKIEENQEKTKTSHEQSVFDLSKKVQALSISAFPPKQKPTSTEKSLKSTTSPKNPKLIDRSEIQVKAPLNTKETQHAKEQLSVKAQPSRSYTRQDVLEKSLDRNANDTTSYTTSSKENEVSLKGCESLSTRSSTSTHTTAETQLQLLLKKGTFDTEIDISYHVQDWYEKEPKAFLEKRKYYKDENDRKIGKMRHTYPVAITHLIQHLVSPIQRFSLIRQRWDDLYQYPGQIIDYSQEKPIMYDGVFEEAFDKKTHELSHHFFRPESLATSMSNFRTHNSYGTPSQEEISVSIDTISTIVTNFRLKSDKDVIISETLFTYIIDDTRNRIKYVLPRDFS